MATVAPPRPQWAPRARALALARVRDGRVATALTVLGLLALTALSFALRIQHMDVGYWIDEGISIGIADRPLSEIPGALRLDGAPPLFYVLLHFWIGLTGSDSEWATHSLSLTAALLTIPVGYLLTRSLFGRRAAWLVAVLLALNPFLTQYAQETRMYALVVLLGTIATAAFLGSLVLRRRRWLPWFALSLAALLYTHNWSFFFAGATGLTWLGLVWLEPREGRRALLRDGVLAYAGVLALYAPWVPTTLFQVAHTGAPWALRPGLDDLIGAPSRVLGSVAQMALLLAGGTGVAAVLGRRRLDGEARAAIALISISILTILLAWLMSQVSPAWAVRYLAIALGPLLLLAAFGLARAARLGIVALALVALLWSDSTGRSEKSNVRSVAESLSPSLGPGDLVVSTQPEQVPVLAHYLPDGLEYATLWGSVDDVGVTDWRDGVTRLEQTSAPVDLRPLLDSLPPGRRLVLVQPTIYSIARWAAPWTGLVRVRSEEWSRAVREDDRFRVSAIYPPSPYPEHPNPVKATVYIKRASATR